jgi:hypothetical protein
MDGYRALWLGRFVTVALVAWIGCWEEGWAALAVASGASSS